VHSKLSRLVLSLAILLIATLAVPALTEAKETLAATSNVAHNVSFSGEAVQHGLFGLPSWFVVVLIALSIVPAIIRLPRTLRSSQA